MAAAAKAAGLKATVFNENALRRKGFGALLAVAAGSDHPPAMAVLEHKPRGAKKTVVLVGKGVTFDSGGINLKPAGSQIEEMKMDMAGAAAVAGALISAARLNPPMHIVGVLPLVENMPSGRATRPGDIIKSYAGKTVEIGNTDAEGRLVLADALAHADLDLDPDVLVDVATLTGAARVALARSMAPLYANDDVLRDGLVDAAERAGEPLWPFPLVEDYTELIESPMADADNSGRGGAGSITAALFLRGFIGERRWAHLDIAGPGRSDVDEGILSKGGTGFGTRTLVCWLQAVAAGRFAW